MNTKKIEVKYLLLHPFCLLTKRPFKVITSSQSGKRWRSEVGMSPLRIRLDKFSAYL
ncbi:MAG: hypothetical protein WD038_01815 [Balneolales bacterium]